MLNWIAWNRTVFVWIVWGWRNQSALLFTHSWRENDWIHTFPKGISAVKCNQSRPGFELVSPCPFPTTITITPQAPHWNLTIRLFRVIIRTLVGGGRLTPLQRCNRCILQPQPTGPHDTRWRDGGLTPLQRCNRCILQPQPTGLHDTRWRDGGLTPLQRCNRCILQPQPTGPHDTRWRDGGLTPLQRCNRCILQPQPTGLHDTRWRDGGLSPQQRCNRCIPVWYEYF